MVNGARTTRNLGKKNAYNSTTVRAAMLVERESLLRVQCCAACEKIPGRKNARRFLFVLSVRSVPRKRRKIFSRSMQVETGAEPLAAQAAFKSAQALGKNPPGLPGKAAQECTQVNACAPVSALNASMGKVLHPVSLTIYKTVTMEHFARTSRLKIGVACKNAARRS